MILVDYRKGSKELITPLTDMGLPVERADLPAGDLMWIGRGEKGAEVTIGVEFKKLNDLLSSLRTERLQGEQLPKMRAFGPDGKPAFDFAYLLIEGEFDFDKRGRLLKYSRFGRKRKTPIPGAMTIGELLKRLNVLHLCGGLNRIQTTTRRQTLMEIAMLYRTWTDTDLDKHKSHLAIYQPEPLVPISDTVFALKALPGCGLKVAKAAEARFGHVYDAVVADEADWAELTTTDDNGKHRRFGMAAATRLVNFLRGR